MGMPPIRFIIDIVVVVTVIGLVFFLYQTYGPRLVEYLFGEQKVAVSIRDVSIAVTVADDIPSRQQGLSHKASLPEREGMLFVFDREDSHYFWMKDMLIPIDIIWINDAMEIVHIERNIRPESFPTRYGSSRPARFVLEVNAFFVDTFSIKVGDQVSIPSHRIPADLR